MDAIEKRALYHLLRMNWLNEPTLPVHSWQIEDYRALSLTTLIERLEKFGIYLERTSFIAYADECDSPEDLTDSLIVGQDLNPKEEDQIYLIVFELWRRLMNEKASLSIVCYELDHQIYLYDSQSVDDFNILTEMLNRFIYILNENVDGGIPPQQAFQLISAYCANDIETFLYDFISEQIDEERESYAHELLDNLDIYLGENKWFKLLRLRLCEHLHSKTAQKLIGQILEEEVQKRDLDFNLEFLSILIEIKDQNSSHFLVQQILPLIQREEDFRDLISITIDYFHQLERKPQELTLKSLFENRLKHSINDPIENSDPDLITFSRLFD